MTLPVHFAFGERGAWNQGLFEAAIDGSLWPMPVGFEVSPTADYGAIVMAHGEVAKRHGHPDMERLLSLSPWALLFHASDEHVLWDSSVYWRRNVRTWMHHWAPGTIDADRRVLLGWRPGTRAGVEAVPRFAVSGRSLWSFAGQAQNDSRRAMLAAVKGRPDGQALVSDGFAQGLPQSEYLAALATSAVALCPAGNCSPDTIRLYEALEAGCVPVVERVYPGWPEGSDYWRDTCGQVPFPVVDSWSQLPAILDRYRDDPATLQRDMTRSLAWWIGYKRRFALDLIGDCFAMGAPGDYGPVTVLIPTSPIAAHPSMDMIEQTIFRVRSYAGLERAEIIIMIDGVRPEQEHRRNDYAEYVRALVDRCNWDPRFAGCLPLVFPEYTHQATMARHALELVRTPLVFYVEHDTWPVGKIDFPRIFEAFRQEPAINVVRLHIDRWLHDSHLSFMLDKHPIDLGGLPVIRTVQWSQRPHVARTDFYRKLIRDNFAEESRSMIEDIVYGVIVRKEWAESGAGVCIYAPEDVEGSILRSTTCDGRGEDPKFTMRWVSPDRSQTLELGGMPGKPR